MYIKILVENEKLEINEIHFIKGASFKDCKDYLYNFGYKNITLLIKKYYSPSLDFSFYPIKVKKSELNNEIEIIKYQNLIKNDFNKIKIFNEIK